MIDVEMTNKSGVTLVTNGKYCADNIKVTPQNANNIIPENIKKDVEILGIIGKLENTFEHETIIISQQSNVVNCLNAIFPADIMSAEKSIKFAYIVKPKEHWVENQFIGCVGAVQFTGLRYRNKTIAYVPMLAPSYDCTLMPGDKVKWEVLNIDNV